MNKDFDFINIFCKIDNKTLNEICDKAAKIKRLPRKLKKELNKETRNMLESEDK